MNPIKYAAGKGRWNAIRRAKRQELCRLMERNGIPADQQVASRPVKRVRSLVWYRHWRLRRKMAAATALQPTCFI